MKRDEESHQTLYMDNIFREELVKVRSCVCMGEGSYALLKTLF